MQKPVQSTITIDGSYRQFKVTLGLIKAQEMKYNKLLRTVSTFSCVFIISDIISFTATL